MINHNLVVVVINDAVVAFHPNEKCATWTRDVAFVMVAAMSQALSLYDELRKSFHVDSSKFLSPRALNSKEGVADRLRAAAFAEVQAEAGFLWACETFTDAPPEVLQAWRELAVEEHKHLGWLLARAEALGIDLKERPVSDRLWLCLTSCVKPGEFFHVMAKAEQGGKRAGERFSKDLAQFDPITAQIFGQIAEEETRHIALALSFYPEHQLMASAQPVAR